MAPYEEWLSNDMQGDSDRPEATFIALADGEVAGYAKLSLSKSDSKVAFHDMTGVRRAFRGRGIACGPEAHRDRVGEAAGYEKLQTTTRCATSRSAASTSATATSWPPGPRRPARRAAGPD